jgi:hypothetical protein
MRHTILPVLLLACLACTTTVEERGQRHAAPVGPPDGARDPDAAAAGASREPVPIAWTDAFMRRALLLADEIRVEGPRGLLEHVAVRSDDGLYERDVETTPDGFVQTTSARPDVGELVRGQLDQWQLVANRRIVIIENPAALDVLITARGDALWQDPSGIERRDAMLEFEGPIER